MLSPIIMLMKWKLIKGVDAKKIFLKLHFAGNHRSQLQQYASDYLDRSLTHGLIRPKAKARLAELETQGHTVCIVSASLDIWLQPFADHFKTDLICTRPEYQDNIFTGKIEGRNCNHSEKANKIRAKYDLNDFSRVVAYGDSSGDKAMLQLAHDGLMRPFE